jgi:hypothetical protein
VNIAHSEGRWAGALQLAPPGPLGKILVGHGGAPRSDRYGTLAATDRLQQRLDGIAEPT